MDDATRRRVKVGRLLLASKGCAEVAHAVGIHGRLFSMKVALTHCALWVGVAGLRNWMRGSWMSCGAACSIVQPSMGSAPSCGRINGCVC